MFGYVNIYKNELKVKEYDLFRAYYCGLCKTLKKNYGFASRMGLSYDLTFLSLLLSSVYPQDDILKPQVCVANPLKKKPVILSNKFMEYTSCANVILTYFKIIDDIYDNHSLKSAFFWLFMLPAIRKAKKQQPCLYLNVKNSMERLTKLEKAKIGNPDALAEEFATLTGYVFSADIIPDENTKRILTQIGRLIGRYIYLLDACADFDKDKEKNNYNVLLQSDCSISKEELLDSLEFTLSEIAMAYNLLDIKKNKPILDNIIYLGLADSLNKIRRT